MNKYIFSFLLRKAGLIRISDRIRFYINLIKTYKIRKKFSKENKGLKLPPPYYIYETFNLNYYSFHNKSIETAKWLVSYLAKYKKLANLKILDWGCGPGRVIRHLPNFVSGTCSLYGTDYNEKYIKWCTRNLPSMIFGTNNLGPPLKFEDEFFDIVYGISIFTHLSEKMHYAWFNELIRVTKTGGILFLTFQGESFRKKLIESEKKSFDEGKLLVKANTKEGHRTYSAFHPPSFVRHLSGKNEILEHVPGMISKNIPEQDVWIIRKK